MTKEPTNTNWAALHGSVFIAIVVVVALCLPFLRWPWYLFVPLAAYHCIALTLPFLRRTTPRLAVGRLTGFPLLYAAILIAVTSGVLVLFHVLMKPDVTDLAGTIPVSAFGNIVLAWICFSVINATLEELVFRGMMFDALSAEWNVAIAITVTSILFGLGHVRGYPPGPLGAILAGGYGVTLGLLRWWTGGLGLAVICHSCADASIFGLLLWAGAFEGVI